MKKIAWMVLVGLLLTMVFAGSAMAAGTGIQFGGKIYTFYGANSTNGTYEFDQVTFVIEDGQVTIKQDGKPDEVHQLYSSTSEQVIVVENTVENTRQTANSVDVIYNDGTLASGATEVTTIIMQDRTADSLMDQRESYDVYAQYGLTYNETEKALYYQGKAVRIFKDEYPLADQAYQAIEKVNLQGTIDIIAKRDVNYQLTGLYVLSQDDFSSRDLTSYLPPANATATAVCESGPMTPGELKKMFDAYAHLGLTYDVSTDILTYQGKTVRSFTDVQQSNGESMNSGRFSGMITGLTNDFGVIDVETVRDYTKLDNDGNGTLTGLVVTNIE